MDRAPVIGAINPHQRAAPNVCSPQSRHDPRNLPTAIALMQSGGPLVPLICASSTRRLGKEREMKIVNAKSTAIALGLSGAMILGAIGTSGAAPVLANTTAVKSALPTDVSDVRWRRSGRNAAIAGFAAGTILGLGVAAASRPHYYYDSPGYAYDPYYYDSGPAYYYESAPAYGYAPSRSYYSRSTPTY
jgi:hypothetical protein